MKKVISVLLIFAVFATFTACTGSERLTHMTIVQGLALDVADSGVSATIQYLDLNKGNGKNEEISGNITSYESARGADIKSAIANVSKKLPDALFFGQNKIIVISPDFELRYSRELREYLVKNKESRPDVFILKSRGKRLTCCLNPTKTQESLRTASAGSLKRRTATSP